MVINYHGIIRTLVNAQASRICPLEARLRAFQVRSVGGVKGARKGIVLVRASGEA